MLADMVKKAAKSRAAAAKRVGGVRLLSGGNPQIPKGDGEGPVRAYIAAMPGWKRGLGERLDGLISVAVPGVKKGVRWNSALYGVEGRGWFLGFHCLTKYVKVAFFKGAGLGPGLTGTAKSGDVRYLDVFEGKGKGDLDEARFVEWVRRASEQDGWDGGS
jgi:hypothetical protein